MRLILTSVALAVLCLVRTGEAQTPPPQDQRGRDVSVAAPAQRVVTFNSVLWLYLTLERGAGPIAGASASTVRTVSTGLLDRAFPSAAAIPTDVSVDGFFVPNVEAILRRAPDAVFQWVGRNDPAYLEPLDRAGLPVVALRQTRDERDYFSTARLIGAVSGRSARAEALIDDYRDSYARLDHHVQAGLQATKGRRQRVLYLWKWRPLIPIDGKNFFGTLLERAGGVNVAAQLARPERVSMEKILLWDPEVVVLFCCDRTTPSDLYQDPMWRPVSAVRNRRVYKVPSGGSRFADLVEGPLYSRWLTELLFPELPSTLRGDLRQTFQQVYGLDLDDDTLDHTLHMKVNSVSAGYDRFSRSLTQESLRP